MGKLYVFAIGGSGSRVLRSLTMLLANGIKLKCGDEIVPLIIDPDSSNGDLVRTVDLMRLYNQLHSQLVFGNNVQNTFFCTDIKSFNNADYLLPLEGTSGITFDNFMQVSTMSKENQALMKMLFSEKNLASNMDVGFKGNPNIGSVVLNQFIQSGIYKAFENDFIQGDKVFIISSIFGGTGASGFPLLLKTLRTSTNSALAEAPIGAVSLLPYFNLKADDNSEIKADSFVTKAKAALNYYEKNVSGNNTLNDMYYLGDSFSSGGYNNNDGGSRQSNPAHLIELLSALAIIDYDSKQAQPQGPTNFHEFGMQSGSAQTVNFSDFGYSTQALLMRPMAQFAIFNAYLSKRSVSHRISQKWARDRNQLLGGSFFSSSFYKEFNMFLSYYNAWLTELKDKDNKIGFNPFLDNDKNDDILSVVDGIKPEYRFLSKKSCDLLDVTLSNNLSNVQRNSSAPQTFMELFYTSTKELCERNLKI